MGIMISLLAVISITAGDTNAVAPRGIPTAAALRIGVVPLTTMALSSRATSIPRRQGRITMGQSIAVGALIGSLVGLGIYSLGNSGDHGAGMDPNPLTILVYTAIGASIGFMAKSGT